MTKDANLNTPAVLASIAKALREAENLRLKVAVEELCESAAPGGIDYCNCEIVRLGDLDILECEAEYLKVRGPLVAISNAYQAQPQRTINALHPWEISPHLFPPAEINESDSIAMDALIEQIRRYVAMDALIEQIRRYGSRLRE